MENQKDFDDERQIVVGLSRYFVLQKNTTASDEHLEAYIRGNLATTYHPAGTCKMGLSSDPMAVVDERLLVHGVTGLRVADASIMPNLIGGNTAAPATMIGERAADFILRKVTAGVLDGIAAYANEVSRLKDIYRFL